MCVVFNVPYFSYVFGQTGLGKQRRNSLIKVYTVCNSICIVWTHYSMVEPHSLNFRVITTNILGVRIFRKFTVSAKGNKTSNNSKMHIHVKGIDHPSKEEISDWNQRRRQEHPSNSIGVQFFICAFRRHISSCFSHQKSERRTSNQVK